MKNKSGIKEVLLLIVALIVFVVAILGIYKFDRYLTTALFVAETVIFLILLMMLAAKIGSTDSGAPVSEADQGLTQESAQQTVAPVNMTVVSAPVGAAVGTMGAEQGNAEAATVIDASAQTVPQEKPEPEKIEVIREVTKLKTVLFNEDLLEEKEDVDLGDVVKETLEIMDPFAKAAGIRTGFVCSGEVTYKASRMLLSVMMKNIVDNAVKYMRRAGNLHITVSNVADDIFIVCKDDGLGIGKDELPYIFDLNFQGSNRVSGNGLGLTQARDIVNAYGGTIYAKSAPGSGMGIYIQLPGKNELEA